MPGTRKEPASGVTVLRRRLVVLLAIMVLPFCAFSVFKTYDINKERTAQHQQANLARARGVANSIDSYVESTEEILNAIAYSDAAIDQDTEALNRWFVEILSRCGHYGNLVYFDTRGNLIASARTPEAGQIINVSDVPWFKRSMVSTELAIGDFSYSQIGGVPDVHLSLPVFDRAGQRIGLVSAAMNLTRVQDRVMRETAPSHITISVVDRDGVVIARNRDAEKWVGKKVLNAAQVNRMLTEHEGSGESVSRDGRRMTGSFTQVAGTPWFVRVGVNADYISSLVAREVAGDFIVFLPLLLVSIAGWLWIGRDVDRLHRHTEKLSLVDALTQLGNSRRLHDDMERAVQHSLRSGEPLSFAMLDLDDFKLYNDRFGHLAGDAALSSAARAIEGAVRAADHAYRYGGEEFCILLPDADADGAESVAERVRLAVAALELRPDPASAPVSLSISIGVSVFPDTAHSGDELMTCADAALYQAKREGKNRVAVYRAPAVTDG